MRQDKPLRALHLFAGAGGSVQACRKLGMESVGCVEIDRYCCAVLEHHGEKILANDITSWDASGLVGLVDVVVGGSPCQDVSTAGKRAGFNGTKSVLWRDQVRVARECQAPLIWWENVRGALSSNGGRDFGVVLSDLANAGYDARWVTNRAADVGAPHRRERLWLFAWRKELGDPRNGSFGQWPWSSWREGWKRASEWCIVGTTCAPLGLATRCGLERCGAGREQELEPQDVLATATGCPIHGISSSGSTYCADQHAGGHGGGVPEVAELAHATGNGRGPRESRPSERQGRCGHVGCSCGTCAKGTPELAHAGGGVVERRGVARDIHGACSALGEGEGVLQQHSADHCGEDGEELVDANGRRREQRHASERELPEFGEGRSEGLAHADVQRREQQRGAIAVGEGDHPVELQGRRAPQPVLGGATHGVEERVDCPADRGLWPAPQGQPQYPWEAPRTLVEQLQGRTHRLKALGNGWVPQQAVLAWLELTSAFDP